MRKYTDPVINYGCKRVAAKNGKAVPEHKQPKDLSREWYIYYTYLDPESGKMRPVKYKGGINRHHTERERIKSAMNACEIAQEMLDKGFNPFLKRMQERSDDHRLWLFSEALDHALKVHITTLSGDSLKDYRSAVDLVNRYAKDTGRNIIPVQEISRKQIRGIIDHMQQERGFGNVRHNKLMAIIRSLFGVLVEEEILHHNVLLQMRSRPAESPRMFEPMTKGEKRKFFENIAIAYPAFFTYCMCIYHAGIRPKELLSLKVMDYDRSEGIINVRGGKTSRKMGDRMAPVTPEMSELLERHIEGAHPDFYIFGSGFLPQRRDKPWHRNKATDFWKRVVKDTLGIDKDMYGLKHTGGDDKILADMPQDWISTIFGHASKQMTEKYTRNKNKILLKKIGKSDIKFLPEQESGKG